MDQKGFSVLFIILGFVFIIGVAGGAYFLGKESSPKPSPTSVVTFPTSQHTVTTSPSDINPEPTGAGETANWKMYVSENYGYSFKYPFNFWISSVTTSKKVTSDTSITTISDAPPPPTNTMATMSITDFGQKPGESLNTLVNRYMEDRTEHLIKRSKNITVNNHAALYLETDVSNKRYDLIFIETGNSNVIIITLHAVDNSLQPSINKMLSTFIFTQ